ncbi:MAG: hypothetical protein P8Z79_24450 [Sedimentisphaerales bacterium]
MRQTPNKVLKEYFARKGLLSDIDFDSLGETEIEVVAESLDRLPENERIKIEAEFGQINEMACQGGVRVLVEEAGSGFHSLDWTETLGTMKNHYERAFWAFLNHPLIFEIASELAYMDAVGGWRQYVGEGLTPAVDGEDKDRLAQAVSTFYKKQGRGYHCKVDNYRRETPERHCYFAYPEDFPTTEMGYDENGKFRHWPMRRAFEVIFVYKPGKGFVEISANGKREEIETLQQVFGQNILGLDRLPKAKSKPYELSRLKDKNFRFVTEPQDGIEKVTIKMLRLDLPGFGNRRITLEASSSNGTQPIHNLLEKALSKVNLRLDKLVVAKARLQFKFAARDGKKGRTLTFEISIPDRCTLKDDPLHQIGKKYIEKWGFING